MSAVSASVTDAAEYFVAADKAFHAAIHSVGSSERADLQISTASVTLEFAGSSLVPLLLPALSHLRTRKRTHDELRIRVWDSGTTGVQLPPSPWASGSYEARGKFFDYRDGRVLYRDERFWMYFCQADDVVLLDSERGVAHCWFRDARTLPYYESGAPLRTILQWWLEKQGLIFVHAAAVGHKSGGVLLAGKGGSGKSTTALLCLKSDLSYAADDYCLLQTDPEPTIHCLYNTGKIDAENLSRLPHLADYVQNAEKLEDEKAIVFLHEHLPEKIIQSFPVRALLLPQVMNSVRTEIRPASPADGLRALAPSTIFQLAGVGDGSFQRMAKFVREVPAYHLLLGTDLKEIPAVIQRFVEDRAK